MRRTIILTAAAAAAAVPAVLGLAGNATFSQRVPAAVPANAVIIPTSSTGSPTTTGPTRTSDDHGTHAEPGDDKGGLRDRSTRTTEATHGGGSSTTRTSSHSTTHRTTSRTTSRTSDDHGNHAEPGDDHGRGTEAGDDSGGHGGSGSGKGSDDSGRG